MHRYGEEDFDRDYLEWGMHDPEVQRREAESLLSLAETGHPLRILDLACGTGSHALAWSEHGHDVTGVDISKTFIARARESCQPKGLDARFIVSDIRDIDYGGVFDVVTWIERSFFDGDIVDAIWRALRPGGAFIFDDRNPANPQVRARQEDWRSWREVDGRFTLERHEVNPETGCHEDVWITIDPEAGLIEEKVGDISKPQSLHERIDMLTQAGFHEVRLRTIDGETFVDGPEPSWLWVVADKPEANHTADEARNSAKVRRAQ